MLNLKRGRVKRGPPPKKPIKRHNYADCLPELMRDFEGRCAYSMQHHERAGKLEVDHFDPRKKKHLIQAYENLFPASRHCNGKKSNHWPTREELAAGCRFLNPCEEVDYGDQVFEDPRSHLLVGATPAARWHIRMCGLNADHLVLERSKRTQFWDLLKRKTVHQIKESGDLIELIQCIRGEVQKMIPEIPEPPLIGRARQ